MNKWILFIWGRSDQEDQRGSFVHQGCTTGGRGSPEIAAEWDYRRNGQLHPDDLPPGCGKPLEAWHLEHRAPGADKYEALCQEAVATKAQPCSVRRMAFLVFIVVHPHPCHEVVFRAWG